LSKSLSACCLITFLFNHRLRMAKKAVSPPPVSNVRDVLGALAKDYKHAECELRHENAFQLLVATILSAQCTDERVNQVTETLFQKYPTPADFATLDLKVLEEEVRPTGFFRNKAKSVKNCCIQLVDDYGAEVPEDIDEMVKLAGVGRKTANLVLGVAFAKPTGIVVDTHVGRVSKRLGLTNHKDGNKVEQDLLRVIPQEEWIDFSTRMIHHGRYLCKAKKPQCSSCSMNHFCPQIGVEV
jgi:endonuclease-3